MAALHPTDLPGVQTLFLLGPDEPAFWPAFQLCPEAQDGHSDPMDRWSSRVIGDLATQLGATAYFPFGGPPFQPFIAWALQSDHIWQSPVGLLLHAQAGLFVSFRGALGFAQHITLPPVPKTSPCDSCVDQPCRTACPVTALTAEGYDVATCKDHIASASDNSCFSAGCLVRRACPISQSYGRLPAHSAFHMKAFL